MPIYQTDIFSLSNKVKTVKHRECLQSGNIRKGPTNSHVVFSEEMKSDSSGTDNGTGATWQTWSTFLHSWEDLQLFRYVQTINTTKHNDAWLKGLMHFSLKQIHLVKVTSHRCTGTRAADVCFWWMKQAELLINLSQVVVTSLGSHLRSLTVVLFLFTTINLS